MTIYAKDWSKKLATCYHNFLLFIPSCWSHWFCLLQMLFLLTHFFCHMCHCAICHRSSTSLNCIGILHHCNFDTFHITFNESDLRYGVNDRLPSTMNSVWLVGEHN